MIIKIKKCSHCLRLSHRFFGKPNYEVCHKCYKVCKNNSCVCGRCNKEFSFDEFLSSKGRPTANSDIVAFHVLCLSCWNEMDDERMSKYR